MGYTPLHVAAAFGYLDIGKQLIESGAKVNSRDAHGRFVVFKDHTSNMIFYSFIIVRVMGLGSCNPQT